MPDTTAAEAFGGQALAGLRIGVYQHSSGAARDIMCNAVPPVPRARAEGRSVAELVAGLPPRFTAANCLKRLRARLE